MIEYWHWHTLHFGAETYWGGVLPHNGRPGRTYAELSRLGGELEAAGEVVAGLTPDADVTMLYSLPSKWLMQKYPPLSHDDGSPDDRSYQGLFDPFYRGAFDAGLQVRVLHTGQFTGAADELAAQHPVLVVPGLYIADDTLLDLLVDYAAAGGHLVVGPRTAYADEEARARTAVMPARLSEAAGVWYDEYSNLSVDLPVRVAADSPLELAGTAAGTRWADGLQVTDAEVLARYEHPHFGRWQAVTTRVHGKGRITYVGTIPGPELAAALFRWIVPQDRQDLPASVTVTSGTARDGRRVRFVHNWSWEPVDVDLPGDCRDAVDGTSLGAGEKLTLGAWDVRVLLET
jgi:beta-galactosidase